MGKRGLICLIALLAGCGGSDTTEVTPDSGASVHFDAAIVDAAIPDAPLPDAPSPDAPLPDAPLPDAPSPPDARPPDAPPPPDASAPDAPAPPDAPPPPDAGVVTGTHTTSLWFARVFDSPGKVGVVAGAWDTAFELVYAQGLPADTVPPGLTANLYLYDDNGALLRSKTGGIACGPCATALKSGTTRARTLVVEDLLVAAGGMPDGGASGFAVITLTGAGNPSTFVATQSISQGHTIGATDIDSAYDHGVWIPEDPPAAAGQAIFFPWFRLDDGVVGAEAQSLDSTLSIVATSGLPAGTTGTPTVSLFLRDQITGGPLLSATQLPICDPCLLPMGGDAAAGAAPRVRRVKIDELALAKGGIGGDRRGWAYLTVSSGHSADVATVMTVTHSRGTPEVQTLTVDSGRRVAVAATTPASSRLLFSNILDSNGDLGGGGGTGGDMDAEIDVVYTRGLAAGTTGEATVRLYLYDSVTGAPLTSASSTVVCGPCEVTVGGDGAAGPKPRSKRFVLEELLTAKGGLPASGVAAFGILTVSSGDPNDVAALLVQTQRGKPSSGSLNLGAIEGHWQEAAPPGLAPQIVTYIIPHVLESETDTFVSGKAFDTSFFATYTSGLAGVPAGGGAHVDLYVFDSTTGTPMKTGNNADVCKPCSIDLGAVIKRAELPLASQLASGGFPRPLMTGFAILVVSGSDPRGGIKLPAFTTSHGGAFDVSVFGFDPIEIAAAAKR